MDVGLSGVGLLGFVGAATPGALGLVPCSGAIRGAILGASGLGKSMVGVGVSVIQSGVICTSWGRIPFASMIDQRQSSSGPGVIPIFSLKVVVLKGFAVALR